MHRTGQYRWVCIIGASALCSVFSEALRIIDFQKKVSDSADPPSKSTVRSITSLTLVRSMTSGDAASDRVLVLLGLSEAIISASCSSTGEPSSLVWHPAIVCEFPLQPMHMGRRPDGLRDLCIGL